MVLAILTCLRDWLGTLLRHGLTLHGRLHSLLCNRLLHRRLHSLLGIGLTLRSRLGIRASLRGGLHPLLGVGLTLHGRLHSRLGIRLALHGRLHSLLGIGLTLHGRLHSRLGIRTSLRGGLHPLLGVRSCLRRGLHARLRIPLHLHRLGRITTRLYGIASRSRLGISGLTGGLPLLRFRLRLDQAQFHQQRRYTGDIGKQILLFARLSFFAGGTGSRIGDNDSGDQQNAKSDCHIQAGRALDVAGHIAKMWDAKSDFTNDGTCTYQRIICILVGIALGAVTYRVRIVLVRNNFNDTVGYDGIPVEAVGNDISDFQLCRINLLDINQRTHRVGRLHGA